METSKSVGCVIAAVLLAVVAFVLLAVSGLRFDRFAQPYQEETRRQTYENSQTYNDGMAITLDDLCRQMKAATDPDVKNGLAETIRLRASRFHGELPAKTQECVNAIL